MLMPLKIPAGVYRNGTEYQSMGRWFNANLVRWFENTLRPVGGWRKRSSSQVTGTCRGIINWRDDDAERWIVAGTNTKLFVMDQNGTLKDITPTTFTPGNANATLLTGYGSNKYGNFAYGVARPDTGAITPAATWSMDTWGEYWVGCCNSDGQLLEWTLGFVTPTRAIALVNAPTGCAAVMTTSERFVFALGASNNPRLVAWSDQEDNTTWTPASNNQAGSFELTTVGSILAGKRVRGVNLIFTDVDVHTSSYIGQPFVFSFEKAGSGCGLIGPQAVAAIDTAAIWMSRSGFWIYDGYVKPLPSDIGDFVFSNMNFEQASKVYAVHNSKFGEIWWFYTSAASTENDSYCIYNYRENHWSLGTLSRLAGVDKGVFNSPLMVSSDGFIYEHEIGFAYDSQTIFAESGPVQIGNGDQIMQVRQVIPDESNLGDVSISFSSRLYPTGTETSFGPFTSANPTDARFSGRQVKMKVTADSLSDWRVGVMRLDAVPAGKR